MYQYADDVAYDVSEYRNECKPMSPTIKRPIPQCHSRCRLYRGVTEVICFRRPRFKYQPPRKDAKQIAGRNCAMVITESGKRWGCDVTILNDRYTYIYSHIRAPMTGNPSTSSDLFQPRKSG